MKFISMENATAKHESRQAAVYTGSAEQRREIEEKLVKLFSHIIAIDAEDREFPQWSDSTAQLMELAWELWKTGRMIDLNTGQRLGLQQLGNRLCTSLHRRPPKNVSDVARRSRLSRRLPIIQRFGQQWFEGGISPAASIFWHKPTQFPMFKDYKGVF